MRLSARVDYALRAMAELAAAAHADAGPAPRTAEQLAARPGDPAEVPGEHPAAAAPGAASCTPSAARRAATGWPARPRRSRWPQVIRAVDGPLANVRGQRPETLGYQGAAAALQEVWIALRASEREILELVTIADVATGKLPDRVRDLAADPAAWA